MLSFQCQFFNPKIVWQSQTTLPGVTLQQKAKQTPPPRVMRSYPGRGNSARGKQLAKRLSIFIGLIKHMLNRVGVNVYITSVIRRTVVSDGSDGTGLFFRVRCTSFHNHSLLITFLRCFIVLFQSFCSHEQVFGETVVHEFPIFYSHSLLNGTCSLRAPILFCGDVPAIKQLNY